MNKVLLNASMINVIKLKRGLAYLGYLFIYWRETICSKGPRFIYGKITCVYA